MLFEEPQYTVIELTTYIQDIILNDHRLQDVWVVGEVSNMTQAASGHWYFTLKDSKAQLQCVMWRSNTAKQAVVPREGDQIQVHGHIDIYPDRGVYQLYADDIRAAGIGNLYQQFEALKVKLQAEGLFDEARKRPLPSFPQKIGVVTSPTAAAFQDIQNVLRRRFPLAEVILSPTLVQGDEAPSQIVAAIERLNALADVDVILVTRGGGSIEDLWAFNDERVARAIAASRIPTVAGVGHEIDFTIADFVADRRAPTPSAAAEVITPDSAELRADLRNLTTDLTTRIEIHIANLRRQLETVQRTMQLTSPQNRIANQRQRIDDLNRRLLSQLQAQFRQRRERLQSRTAALHAANPQAILERGYAIVYRSKDGSRIQSARSERPGTGITVQLHDGELVARVEDKDTHERYTRTLF